MKGTTKRTKALAKSKEASREEENVDIVGADEDIDSDVDDAIERALAHLHEVPGARKDIPPSSSFLKLSEDLTLSGRFEGDKLKQSVELRRNTSFNKIEVAQSNSSLYTDGLAAPSLTKQKEDKQKTLGKGWFNLQPAKIDESLKRDLKVIKMRNYLDPKRFNIIPISSSLQPFYSPCF